MATIPQFIAKPLCITFSIINIVTLSSFGIYHVVTTRKYNGLNFKKCKPSLRLSFLLVIVGLWNLFNFFDVIVFFPNNASADCDWGRYVGISSYIVFKCVLYVILVCRLREAFGGSLLEYNDIHLRLWSTLLILWSLLNILLSAFTSKSYLDFDGVCITTIQPYSLMSMGILDIVSGIINSYLFIKPVLTLRQQVKLMQKQSNDKIDTTKDLKIVAIKQCILSLIAIITTIFALIGVALTGLTEVFPGTDIVVTCICIILMYKWNSFMVEKMCYWFISPMIDTRNLEIIIHGDDKSKKEESVKSKSNKESIEVVTSTNTE